MFALKPDNYRKDFPVLEKKVTYFDSACMALKPKQVVAAMQQYYNEFPACAGRSAHALARNVDTAEAKARDRIRSFLGAKHEEEVVLLRNTTEAINTVADSFPFKKGNEVLVSDKEHNSNLLPWLKQRSRGITVKIVPTKADGTLDLEQFQESFTNKTALVAMGHTSNLDGVTHPLKEITKIAHEHGAQICVDAAQSVPHKEVNVKKLGVDFLAASGHKMCGPSGTGILYGKKEALQSLHLRNVGGETVKDSTYDNYTVEDLPMRFEAGLQDYAGIIGFGEACRYLQKIGLSKIRKHEIKLNAIITEGLPNVQLIGPQEANKRGGIFSFIVPGLDHHEIAGMLNAQNICVRSGAHCVHSWFNSRNIAGSVRASLYFYNTEEEAERFVDVMKGILKLTSSN